MLRTLQSQKDHVHQPSPLGHRDIEIGGMEKTLDHNAKYSINCGVFRHVKQLIFKNHFVSYTVRLPRTEPVHAARNSTQLES